MRPLNAAVLGLLAGVTAMWFGGDALKALVSGDGCGCPNPGVSASSHEDLSAAGHIAPAGQAPKHVAPWEPFDEVFRGCEGGCGERAQTEEAGVVVQTASAAKIGDKVYCPVSGVVFSVGEGSPKRDVNGTPMFFCCEGCAAYFTANQARILAARGSWKQSGA